MIDHIMGGTFMEVISSSGSRPYINNYTTDGASHVAGDIVYDNTYNKLKVYDGYGWQYIGGGDATVNLSSDAITILNWAKQKMHEEAELQILCDQSPAIKDLVHQMNVDISTYKNKIEMVKTLIKKEETIGTS